MKKFNLQFLSTIFPNYIQLDPEKEIHQISIDSRKEQQNQLFIPIIGERFDAHDFIPQAIENGAVAILSSRQDIGQIPDDVTVFYVEDTTIALQQLATSYRDLVNPVVIGVTGSNGKTTTKEIVASCLRGQYNVWKTEGNLNNHIGLPLTVLSMEPNTDALVAEMGMNSFGEIERLSHIVKPNYGIITNIGTSHIEHLGSREGIAQAKLEITAGFNDSSVLIIDGDEPLITQPRQFKQLTCGFSSQNDYSITDVSLNDHSTVFNVNGSSYEIPLLGSHQAKNATFALALCDSLGLNAGDIKQNLTQLSLPSMRFEQQEGLNGSTIINDAYNASATSMIASIDVIKHMDYNKKIVVLGDILELGEFSKEEHYKVGQAIDSNIDYVLTIGEESQYILEGLPINYKGVQKHFEDKKTMSNYIKDMIDSDTVVLLKASRGLQLEEVAEQLKM
ncbi:UDP-N-acetylmuramoyl-tripeptide--D-alanyl-D-alanine ligase [Aquisalibacillus elongatus]|uniref:UDP-N-acetylmuramoyl-tripeptide--D-alanyl-D-alanine ligase n=1 Tax=Aquisalibacillus elongatus TaxID=485577 RepID=A0A3N5C928_9BACI|nr:UDP-N-acetylmuramoyl-tripeptide--D-alanyl-D-alanine ligase [Aquisalibacillus elongatus]RPF56082.1 UDP-N-acetylmuramoyl-tripeptide--D-alanyl-D-alanine ligase [Aquisalibacillus elongatus]